MVFSSVIFIFVFLPIVLGLYYLLPKREAKNITLLVASLFFYWWGEQVLVILLIISSLLNYATGVLLHIFQDNARAKKLSLALGIALNIALLDYYKYFDFGIELFNRAFDAALPLKGIALPIGISFFTFQGMSYIIDLYRGQTHFQKNPLKIALYIALFPQLIAGPIVRYADVENQISTRIETAALFWEGATRFIFGLSKKVLIADALALIADPIFTDIPQAHTAATLWLGALAYMLQIYFDFSGYSDMAIGLGLMFGFRFRENFDYPYISASISEFWRRWHISLGTWFRDYLYYPILYSQFALSTGRKLSKRGHKKLGQVLTVSIGLAATWFLTGLWHGAGLTFIAWGLWHGAFIAIENIFQRNQSLSNALSSIPRTAAAILSRFYTLFVLLLGYILFRSDSIMDALTYIKRMLLFQSGAAAKVSVLFYLNNYHTFIICLALLLCFPIYPLLKKHAKLGIVGPILLFALFFATLLSVVNQGYSPFLYFRF